MKDKIRQDAVDWFARLQASDVASSDYHEHNQWLSASEAHREAYAEVENEWLNLDGLKDWARDDLGQLNLSQGARMRRRTGVWAGSLAVAASVMVAVSLWFATLETPGLTYETQKAEQRQISLVDGSRVHLNTATAIEVRFKPKVREIALQHGESMFDVSHDGERPFVVSAAKSKIIAIGTRFSVHVDGDQLEVTVLEGRVAIVPEEQFAPGEIDAIASQFKSDPDGADANPRRIVFLEPDRQATIDPSGQIQEMIDVNAVSATAWQQGKLIFDSTPLREVAAEISRYIPGQIRVAADVPDYPVTGVIKIRSPDSMMALLSQVVPITPVRESTTVTVLHRS